MHVCGQTLVLVDNDATISEVNQKLVKTTLKYMFYHVPEDRTFCVNTYGHDVEGEETFPGESSDLAFAADKLEFAAKDSNLSDTLCEVITRWRQSDFACRDIVVFTDGLEGAMLNHEKEELYYLIENSEYPVYVVMLEQENNADAKKGLSAIAVTSGGKVFESDFPGSDAAVDRQITEMIYSAMDEYSQVHWTQYEEAQVEQAQNEQDAQGLSETGSAEGAEDTTDYVETDATEGEISEEPAMFEGQVVYEYDAAKGLFQGSRTVIISAVLIGGGLLAGILASLLIMKKRRQDYKSTATVKPQVQEEEFFDDYELSGISTTELTGDTVLLSSYETETDSPTRLLDGSCAVVTLTDTVDGDRSYRIALAKVMSIGRGNCDVTITGDDALSKRHCELFEKDGDIYVRDLSSSNGTRVNGIKVLEEKLSHGDELILGSRSYTVGLA